MNRRDNSDIMNMLLDSNFEILIHVWRGQNVIQNKFEGKPIGRNAGMAIEIGKNIRNGHNVLFIIMEIIMFQLSN